MSNFSLRKKIIELCKSQATLLWLEGAQYHRVVSVKLVADKLVLALANETSRVVHFERYAVTQVGLQFWSQGRPGVLYRWDRVPNTSSSAHAQSSDLHDGQTPPDDTPPPDMAA